MLGQNDHVIRAADVIVLRQKTAAQQCRQAQHAIEVGRHRQTVDFFRHSIARQIKLVIGVDRQRGELGLLIEPVPKGRAGNGVAPARRNRLEHIHQSIRFRIRLRPQEHGIDRAEDGGVGADPHGQSGDGDECEARRLAEEACGVAQILPDLSPPRAKPVIAHPLLVGFNVAELERGVATRRSRIVPLPHTLRGFPLEMRAHLIRHLAFEAPPSAGATQTNPQANELIPHDRSP